jgi:hypothetical protein
MNPHRLIIHFSFIILYTAVYDCPAWAQKRKAPPGGRVAVVVDERLAALRSRPHLSGKLVRRLGRGRLVAIRVAKSNQDGIVFFLVNINSRTHGWIQREALVSSSHRGDDQRLLRLIESSKEFDRISRTRIFLDEFPRSPLRPEVLLILGDAAEEACRKLSREAARRLDIGVSSAPAFSYFLNYSGLDRYSRQDIGFVFDRETKQYHYDGAAWREILLRFPRTPQAAEARTRLAQLTASVH